MDWPGSAFALPQRVASRKIQAQLGGHDNLVGGLASREIRIINTIGGQGNLTSLADSW